MYFEPYFLSKEDQARIKNTHPLIFRSDDAVAAVYKCLAENVARRVAQPTSRHIGVLLSGGVDSSLLLTLLNLNPALKGVAITCFTAYADTHDKDVYPSKEVSRHFGNQWVGCKLSKWYVRDNLPVAAGFERAGLYVTGANLALMRCLEECQKRGVTELWLGTGLDMMFGGGVTPRQLSQSKRASRQFHDDFWRYSMELLMNRFYRFGSPEMEALAKRYKVRLVAPFCSLDTIVCARTLWAPLLFKGTKDKYPLRLLAYQLGVPRREAFRPKQPLQESAGIFELFKECMFDEIADLVLDGVSARRDAAYYKTDRYLALELYIALKRRQQ